MFKMRLKEVLAEKKLSQGKLSRGADVSLQTVQRMCNDPNYVPNADTLFKVAKYLGVTPEYLYVEIEE